jgi:hypothetical protein
MRELLAPVPRDHFAHRPGRLQPVLQIASRRIRSLGQSGQIAQLVEQWIENPCVAGSIPALPIKTELLEKSGGSVSFLALSWCLTEPRLRANYRLLYRLLHVGEAVIMARRASTKLRVHRASGRFYKCIGKVLGRDGQPKKKVWYFDSTDEAAAVARANAVRPPVHSLGGK